MEKIEISVIIPTKNRAELLSLALDSILKQTLPGNNFEVIIVDNGSSDGTKLVCDKFNRKFVNFKYTYSENPGLHQGRNMGFELSNSEILVYADDDIEAFPTWLLNIKESFRTNSKVGLVTGNIFPNWEGKPPNWILKWWEKSKKIHSFSIIHFGEKSKCISAFDVFGCNYAIKKCIVDAANGFHPDGMPFNLRYLRGDGETYISKVVTDLGYESYFNPHCSVKHFVSKERLKYKYIYQWSQKSAMSTTYSIIRNSLKRNDFLVFCKLSFIAFKTSINLFKSANIIVSVYSFLGFHYGFIFYFYKIYSGDLKFSWIKKKSYF